MALTSEQIAQQRKEAEELLFSGPQTLGFANGLFFGHFNSSLVFPYPQIKPEERETVEKAVAEVRRFAEEHIDAAAIDRNADIPPDVIAGSQRRFCSSVPNSTRARMPMLWWALTKTAVAEQRPPMTSITLQ